MTIYLLYHGLEDDDSREACSIYYTPVEAFDSKQLRDQRIKFLKKQYKSLGLYFHEIDLEPTPQANVTDTNEYYEGML